MDWIGLDVSYEHQEWIGTDWVWTNGLISNSDTLVCE